MFRRKGMAPSFGISKAFLAKLKIGMAMVSSLGKEVVGISVDSWGVDYVLLDADGELISPAFHYRDSRNKASSKAVLKRLEWKEIYEETGLQFINFNTLFQLAAETPERITRASKVLPLADGFNHLLSGVPKAEASLRAPPSFTIHASGRGPPVWLSWQV
jgi:rhamnulokinase